MENPFPDFTNDTTVVEPLLDRIQIWKRFDVFDWTHFLVHYALLLCIVLGCLICVLEGIRMLREYANTSSPYKLYGKVPAIYDKRKE